jgi:hypothetical protein
MVNSPSLPEAMDEDHLHEQGEDPPPFRDRHHRSTPLHFLSVVQGPLWKPWHAHARRELHQGGPIHLFPPATRNDAALPGVPAASAHFRADVDRHGFRGLPKTASMGQAAVEVEELDWSGGRESGIGLVGSGTVRRDWKKRFDLPVPHPLFELSCGRQN